MTGRVGRVLARARTSQAAMLLQSAHPVSALSVALGVTGAAIADHRGVGPASVAGCATLLVALACGLGNDLSDAGRDATAGRDRKPLAQQRLARGNVSFAVAVLSIVAVPVALQSGLVAGAALLACLPVAYLHNRLLHTRLLSFVGWMATAGLLSVFLSAGGSGRAWREVWPHWEVIAAAAGLGLFLHFATSIRDLVGDHASGSRSLPLRIAVRTNALTLLVITIVLGAASVTGMALALTGPGLHWR